MWRRARETDGAGPAVLHDEDVQSSNDEAGRSVSDALQQLKHNHANLMREKKQIEQYAADIEHDASTQEREIARLKAYNVELQRQARSDKKRRLELEDQVNKLQSGLDQARAEVEELHDAAAVAAEDTEATAGPKQVTSEVDEQLIEACKAVDSETLVEIAHRFHQMQDAFDAAQEQVRIGALQLKQSRAECEALSEQIQSRIAEAEVHKRKFRLQVAKTARLNDLLDESQSSLAEVQEENMYLEQEVTKLHLALEQQKSDAASDTNTNTTFEEASLATELSLDGCCTEADTNDITQRIHNIIATAEASIGVAMLPIDNCALRLTRLISSFESKIANVGQSLCTSKQTISDLMEQQRSSEEEMQHMALLLTQRSTSISRPTRRQRQSGAAETADSYLKTLDSLEAQLQKMSDQPRMLDKNPWRENGNPAEPTTKRDPSDLQTDFRSGVAHLLSVLNMATVGTSGGQEDYGSQSQALVHLLCALGRGVIHFVSVRLNGSTYDPEMFQSPEIIVEGDVKAFGEVICALVQSLGLPIKFGQCSGTDTSCQTSESFVNSTDGDNVVWPRKLRQRPAGTSMPRTALDRFDELEALVQDCFLNDGSFMMEPETSSSDCSEFVGSSEKPESVSSQKDLILVRCETLVQRIVQSTIGDNVKASLVEKAHVDRECQTSVSYYSNVNMAGDSQAHLDAECQTTFELHNSDHTTTTDQIESSSHSLPSGVGREWPQDPQRWKKSSPSSALERFDVLEAQVQDFFLGPLQGNLECETDKEGRVGQPGPIESPTTNEISDQTATTQSELLLFRCETLVKRILRATEDRTQDACGVLHKRQNVEVGLQTVTLCGCLNPECQGRCQQSNEIHTSDVNRSVDRTLQEVASTLDRLEPEKAPSRIDIGIQALPSFHRTVTADSHSPCDQKDAWASAVQDVTNSACQTVDVKICEALNGMTEGKSSDTKSTEPSAIEVSHTSDTARLGCIQSNKDATRKEGSVGFAITSPTPSKQEPPRGDLTLGDRFNALEAHMRDILDTEGAINISAGINESLSPAQSNMIVMSYEVLLEKLSAVSSVTLRTSPNIVDDNQKPANSSPETVALDSPLEAQPVSANVHPDSDSKDTLLHSRRLGKVKSKGGKKKKTKKVAHTMAEIEAHLSSDAVPAVDVQTTSVSVACQSDGAVTGTASILCDAAVQTPSTELLDVSCQAHLFYDSFEVGCQSIPVSVSSVGCQFGTSHGLCRDFGCQSNSSAASESVSCQTELQALAVITKGSNMRSSPDCEKAAVGSGIVNLKPDNGESRGTSGEVERFAECSGGNLVTLAPSYTHSTFTGSQLPPVASSQDAEIKEAEREEHGCNIKSQARFEMHSQRQTPVVSMDMDTVTVSSIDSTRPMRRSCSAGEFCQMVREENSGQVSPTFERKLALSLSRSSEFGSWPTHASAELTAVARFWVRSCMDFAILHVCSVHEDRRDSMSPVRDLYADRYGHLDRNRLSDELVTVVAEALDEDDRERVLYLTELLPPTDFDALSEMIAEGINGAALTVEPEIVPPPQDTTELGADVAFLLGEQDTLSKADGFITRILAIFNSNPQQEPEVHVTPAFQQRLASHCASSKTDVNDPVQPVGIQKRFLELCRDGGTSLTYLRVKKVLVGEFGPQLFQKHRDFFVSHLEGTSRSIEEKENTVVPDAGPVIANGAREHRTSVQPSPLAENRSTTPLSIDAETAATIDNLSQELVTAKAAMAKAKWQEESYRVYVRNRDRILSRIIQDLTPQQNLNGDSLQLLLTALQDSIN
eukprot:m.273545 g.273545  ORF g.273545 m.273545 type:complete len:1775 (-) comp16120_c0_seq1:5794-11118(-)